MSTDDPLDLDRVDQEIRINELKEEARELAGDDMHSWESPDCPPGLAEAFWSHDERFSNSDSGIESRVLQGQRKCASSGSSGSRRRPWVAAEGSPTGIWNDVVPPPIVLVSPLFRLSVRYWSETPF